MEKKSLEINGVAFDIYKDSYVFGDGDHETTRNMLLLMDKYGVKGKDVLDIGTGTGILSVYSAKCGANSVMALDVDAACLEWARKNFKRNNVQVDVEISHVATDIDFMADVVLANLPASAQVENVKTIGKNIKDKGILIITWLKSLDFDRFVKNFDVVERVEGTDYDAYVLKKKGE